MNLFRIIIVIVVISFLHACGRNGAKEAYPGYPKTYPSLKIE